MDLALLVYGISLLHGIGAFFVTCLMVCGALGFFSVVYRFTECDARSYYSQNENEQRIANGVTAMKWLWRFLAIGILSSWVLIFLPTEKTAYTMVGAYAAQKVAENEKVQQMSGKVLTIIEQKLDQYIDEGFEEATKETKKKTRGKKND